MRYKILLFFSLLLSTEIVIGQNLKGVVKDADNNELLSGVTIFVESLKKGTSTTDITSFHYQKVITI